MRTRRVLTAREQNECAAPDEVRATAPDSWKPVYMLGLECAHLLAPGRPAMSTMDEFRRLAEKLGNWPATTDPEHTAKLRADNDRFAQNSGHQTNAARGPTFHLRRDNPPACRGHQHHHYSQCRSRVDAARVTRSWASPGSVLRDVGCVD